MANWLLDYIEMTEGIPSELREQLTSIRELDLKVHNAMDELERDIKQFFSKIDALTPEERQSQYDAFLKKCDVATAAASDKVRVADKLHDLVEKSKRLLDQGLEKLKEDLLESDKAYIVEDLERRSQELDEQQRLEQEAILQRQQQRLRDLKGTQSKSHRLGDSNHQANSHSNHRHNHHHHNHHHHLSHLQNSQHNVASTNHHRSRNNSTGTQQNSVGRQKKRERKRINSAMTIFNRNSRTDDDSTNQTFLSSPSTPEYLAGLQNSNSSSLNDVSVADNSGLGAMKGIIGSNRNFGPGLNDKSNGHDPLARAKQPILTAIDAAHAVSPNATNSDKLVLFSSNANGDIHNISRYNQTTATNSTTTTNTTTTTTTATKLQNSSDKPNNSTSNLQLGPGHKPSQLSNHLLSPIGFNSGSSSNDINHGSGLAHRDHHHQNQNQNHDHYHHQHHHQNNHNHNSHNHHLHSQSHGRAGESPFSTLPLSARHDPIMMAASQAINATQNMTPGRRTSSLKASYAAVNSGCLQTASNEQQPLFEQGAMLHTEVYCKCRGSIQDPNMIACDNRECKYEWFHYECVGITTPPEGEWYCDDCRVLLGRHNKTTNSSNKQSKASGLTAT